jgi:hypothetical protein
MKKIKYLIAIFASFALLCSFQSYSQTAMQGEQTGYSTTYTSNTSDTVTNTGTRSQLFVVSGYIDILTFRARLTGISGTKGGTLWITASTKNTDAADFTPVSDTTTVSSTSPQSVYKIITPANFKYYRVNYTGTGTMAVRLQSSLLWIRKPNY